MKLLQDLQENDAQLRRRKQEVYEWLGKYVEEIKNNNPLSGYTIDDNLLVHCEGHVTIKGFEGYRLPVKFGKVKGMFNIEYCPNLTTLIGCPTHCQAFNIGPKRRAYLPGDPPTPDHSAKLKNLVGSPQYVSTSYTVSSSLPFSLEGATPKVSGSVYLNAPLENLHNVHKYFKEIGNILDCASAQLESHVLGALLIKGIKAFKANGISNGFKLTTIVNNHMKDHDILACQDELIEAGFAAYAKI